MSSRKLKFAMIAALLSSFLSLCASAAFDGTAGQAHARKNRDHVRQSAGERDLERLRRIMIPLVRSTNHPERLNEISIKIVADSNINAGSAGEGEFVITTGLLQKANDEQLRGILAHEIAHDDLGHPVKMQLVGTGVSLGAALLEQVFPGSGARSTDRRDSDRVELQPSAGIRSGPACSDDSTTRRIFERGDGSHADLDHAGARQQRRRFLIEPSGNRRAHSCSQRALASAKDPPIRREISFRFSYGSWDRRSNRAALPNAPGNSDRPA